MAEITQTYRENDGVAIDPKTQSDAVAYSKDATKTLTSIIDQKINGATVRSGLVVSGDAGNRTLGIQLSPDTSNAASLTDTGLFVPKSSGGGITGATSRGGLVQSGTTLGIQLASDATNAASLTDTGLYVPAGGGGGSPTGPAFGDLTGQYPAPLIRPADTNGYLLTTINSTAQWAPFFGISDITPNKGLDVDITETRATVGIKLDPTSTGASLGENGLKITAGGGGGGQVNSVGAGAGIVVSGTNVNPIVGIKLDPTSTGASLSTNGLKITSSTGWNLISGIGGYDLNSSNGYRELADLNGNVNIGDKIGVNIINILYENNNNYIIPIRQVSFTFTLNSELITAIPFVAINTIISNGNLNIDYNVNIGCQRVNENQLLFASDIGNGGIKCKITDIWKIY